jgi:hypothetical protein
MRHHNKIAKRATKRNNIGQKVGKGAPLPLLIALACRQSININHLMPSNVQWE